MNIRKWIRIFAVMMMTLSIEGAWANAKEFSVDFSNSEKYLGFGPVIPLSIGKDAANFVIDTGSAPTMIVESSVLTRTAEPQKLCDQRIPVKIGKHFSAQLVCALIPGISEFKTANLSGMLSPQSLATDGLVIIDFVNKKISRHSVKKKSSEDFFKEKFQNLKIIKTSIVGSSLGAIFIEASLGARNKILIDLDTGSPYSFFSERYIGAVAFVDRFRVKNIAGEILQLPEQIVSESLQVEGAILSSVKAKAWKEPRSAAGIEYEGSIGRDILSRCAIGIAPHDERTLFLACQ